MSDRPPPTLWLAALAGLLLMPALTSPCSGQAAQEEAADTWRDPFLLRRDPKLRCSVTIRSTERLGLSEILKRLQEKTGLTLTVAPLLADLQPSFDFSHFPDPTAWMLMERIIHRDLVEGGWRKSPGGYQLCAMGLKTPEKRDGPPDPLSLRRDARLAAEVSIVATEIRLTEVLKPLQNATGLALSIDPVLRAHDPVFEHIQIKKGPAWAVMEMTARKHLEDGHWIKVPDGYRLTAKKSLVGTEPVRPKLAAVQPTILESRSRFPLRGDSRLQARLDLSGTYYRLPDLLSRLEKATGLTFATADDLADHDPDLGHLQLPKAHAWAVMELLQGQGLNGGRWEKVAGGYRLVGTSTVPRVEPERAGFFTAVVTPALIGVCCLVALAVSLCALLAPSRRGAAQPKG